MVTYQIQYMDTDGWHVLYSEDGTPYEFISKDHVISMIHILKANLFLDAGAWRWVDSTGNRDTVGLYRLEALNS